MKISTVLRRAAAKHLWDGSNSIGFIQWRAMSNAIYAAAIGDTGDAHGRTLAFVHSLGMDPLKEDAEFMKLELGQKRQGARYLFLLFAHKVAKDEGL